MNISTIVGRKSKYLLVALYLVTSMIFSLLINMHAFAATVTWIGSAGDYKFSTGANWSGGNAPVDGDIVVLDANVSTIYFNDIQNLGLAGITVTGSPASGYASLYGYPQGTTFTDLYNPETLSLSGAIQNLSTGEFSYYGNLSLTGDTTLTDVASFTGSGFRPRIDMNGHNLSIQTSDAHVCTEVVGLSGTGSVTVNVVHKADIDTYISNTGYDKSTDYSGDMTINGGEVLWNLGTGIGSTTLTGGTTLYLEGQDDRLITGPLSISGGSSIRSIGTGAGGNHCTLVGLVEQGYRTLYTFSGPLTLGSNFTYNGPSPIALTGLISYNGYTIENNPGNINAPVVIGLSGIATIPLLSFTYADSQPDTSEYLGYNETANLSGIRNTVGLYGAGSRLSGTGTASILWIGHVPTSSSSKEANVGTTTLAPGNSPGTITALNALYLLYGSVFDVELQNTNQYDKVIAGENYTGSSNAVIIYPLTALGSKLNVSLYDNWNIKAGDQFVIVDNKSNTAVAGYFAGLPEGTQFTVDGITFSITYKGGTGNDIVLTALNAGSAPKAPNTAVANFIKANPFVIMALGIVTAGFFTVLAIRRKSNK